MAHRHWLHPRWAWVQPADLRLQLQASKWQLSQQQLLLQVQVREEVMVAVALPLAVGLHLGLLQSRWRVTQACVAHPALQTSPLEVPGQQAAGQLQQTGMQPTATGSRRSSRRRHQSH
jgi:hypothetical protein